MKVDKLKLVIFEENNDLIEVWEDFFSNNYRLYFMNIKSDQKLHKIDFDDKTIFICNLDIKKNLFYRFRDNKFLFLIDNKRNFKTQK